MESIVSPLSLIGMTIVSFTRFGLLGMVIVGVIVAFLPLHFLIAKILKELGKKASRNRDKRIRRSASAMQGIKPIKMYNL